MTRRSPWGSVRRLPSGRYQARYRVDGVVHAAPRTFRTKRDADAFLARTCADLERGAWADPDAGKVPLAEYAWRWLDERPNLRPRTQELYEGLLRLHVLPALGDTALTGLRSATVRTWHAGLLKGTRPGASTAAPVRVVVEVRKVHRAQPRFAHMGAGLRETPRRRLCRGVAARCS